MCCKFTKNKVYMQDKKFNVKLFILLINKKLHINLSYKVYFWLTKLTRSKLDFD